MNNSQEKNKGWTDFQLKDYVFTELSFNIHSKNFSDSKEEPANLLFDTKTRLFENDDKVDSGEVTLSIRINVDEARKGKAAFDMTAIMSGLFATSEKIPRAEMERKLKSDGLTAMFPFLRSAIAELGRMTNEKRLPTLILPLVDVSAFVDDE